MFKLDLANLAKKKKKGCDFPHDWRKVRVSGSEGQGSERAFNTNTWWRLSKNTKQHSRGEFAVIQLNTCFKVDGLQFKQSNK